MALINHTKVQIWHFEYIYKIAVAIKYGRCFSLRKLRKERHHMIKTLSNVLKQDKEKFIVPRKVQDMIPVQAIWPDGIFFNSKGKYKQEVSPPEHSV